MEHRKFSSMRCPEDTQPRQHKREQSEVPPRGSHHGSVQTPQRCPPVRDCEQGGTSESTCNLMQ